MNVSRGARAPAAPLHRRRVGPVHTGMHGMHGQNYCLGVALCFQALPSGSSLASRSAFDSTASSSGTSGAPASRAARGEHRAVWAVRARYTRLGRAGGPRHVKRRLTSSSGQRGAVGALTLASLGVLSMFSLEGGKNQCWRSLESRSVNSKRLILTGGIESYTPVCGARAGAPPLAR